MINSNESFSIPNTSDYSWLTREMTSVAMVQLLLQTLINDTSGITDEPPVLESVYDYITQANEFQIKQIICAASARLDTLWSSRAQ